MTIAPRARSFALAAAALVALSASAASAGPLQAKQVPADAKWVVHIDADAAKDSTVCNAIRDQVFKRPDVRRGLSELEDLTGVHVPDDIKGVTIYGRQFGEENNVVLVEGTFDPGRILGVLELGPAYSSQSHGTHQIVTWDDKGRTMYGSFVNANLAVIARSAENVKAAHDVLDGQKPAMADVAADATRDGAGAVVYVAGNGLAELVKERKASPLLGHAKGAWVVVGEKDEEVFAKGHVDSPDPAQADKLTKAAEGIRALVSIKASQEDTDANTKRLDELLQPLKLTRVATGIDLDWSSSAATVIDAVKAMAAAKDSKGTEK